MIWVLSRTIGLMPFFLSTCRIWMECRLMFHQKNTQSVLRAFWNRHSDSTRTKNENVEGNWETSWAFRLNSYAHHHNVKDVSNHILNIWMELHACVFKKILTTSKWPQRHNLPILTPSSHRSKFVLNRILLKKVGYFKNFLYILL